MKKPIPKISSVFARHARGLHPSDLLTHSGSVAGQAPSEYVALEDHGRLIERPPKVHKMAEMTRTTESALHDNATTLGDVERALKSNP